MTTRDTDPRLERDVDDEIAFHLESRARELIAHGESDETARRRALAEFGDVTASRREIAAVDRQRDLRGLIGRWQRALGQEVWYGARSLRRAPAFTVAATLVLAIGIGASVTIFSVVDGVLLRPLALGHPERLVAAGHDMPSIGLMHQPQAPATYFTYQRLAQSIDGIGAYREGDVNVAVPGSVGDPERLTDARISATLLPVLQVTPMLGRAFSDEDDRPRAAAVALVSEGLWRSRFGANPSVLGRSIDVDGVPREVIGVMPASFRFPGPTTALWLPLQLDPVEPPAAAFAYGAVARLKAGVTIADAKHDFAAVLPRAPEIVPNFVPGITTRQILDQVHPEPTLVPLRDDMTGAIAGTLWIVAAAASLVLLVACANVTNLTLVRGEARQRDIRVREALGAGRMRLSLQGFVESGLVALAAGLLGLAGAGIAVRLLVNASPAAIPRLAEVSVNARVVIFAVIVVVIVTVACGLAPALRLRRSSDAIHQSGRGQTVGRAQRRLRGALVVVQVAVALVVLAGAGLLVRTVTRLHAVRPGFDAAHVSTYWLSLPAARYQGDPRIAEFYSRLAERAASLPGVEVAGLTSRLPLEVHGQDPNPLYPENDTSFANRLPPLQLLTAVDDGYFRVMDIPLLAGRAFDRMGAQHDGEAIVSSSTAQFFWKDAAGTAVGKRFRLLPGGRLYTVIGVVADVHDTSLTDALSQAVYFPELAKTETAPAQTKRTMALVVRSGREQDDIGAAVRQIVHDLDPMLPVFDVRPMSAVVDAATTQVRFVIVMLGAAAAVTLVLGAVGLYGVLAYVVTLRRRELGIRLALGASPRTVAMALTRDGLVLAAAGIAAGLTIFLLVSRFLGAWLFDVAANDPATIGTSAAVLLAIAMAASWAPARRAARVDPVEALRAD